MKEIKTVICPINCATEYDRKVNNLIANGWVLKKRTTISTQGETSEAFNMPIIQALYAELERYIEYPEEITL